MKNLSELVKHRYPDVDDKTRKMLWEGYINDAMGKGSLWEDALGTLMKHTTQLGKNAKGRDFADNTDAKFAMVVKMKSGICQATINTENKIGCLRICMAEKFTCSDPRLYYMLVPYEVYSKLKGPLKVTFNKWGSPTGYYWDRYQVSFNKVISPVEN